MEVLKSKIFTQPKLFPSNCPKELEVLADFYYNKYLIKYKLDNKIPPTSIPPAPDKAEFHQLNLKGLEVDDARSFGAEHLCKQILDKLALKKCLKHIGFNKK